MNNTQQVEDFLSHHGVKGQKWGIRNQRNSNQNGSSVWKKRILQGAAIGGALAATAVVSSILTKKGMTPVKMLSSSSTVNNFKFKAQSKAVDKGASMLKNILEKNARRNVSTLPKVDLNKVREFKTQQTRLAWQKRL